jgi:hypothetical protein
MHHASWFRNRGCDREKNVNEVFDPRFGCPTTLHRGTRRGQTKKEMARILPEVFLLMTGHPSVVDEGYGVTREPAYSDERFNGIHRLVI